MTYLSLLFILVHIFTYASGLEVLADLYPRQQSLTGGSTCGTLLCVAATVNGTTTSYVLSGRGSQRVGWLAIGFGQQMSDTPMVILWMNSDGTATLSQRKAPSEVMPTVDPNPPREATLSPELSVLSSTSPKLAFTIPTNGDTKQSLIYAFGSTNPGSSAKDATLVQHLDYGLLLLDLTTPISTSTGGSAPTASPDPTGGSPTVAIPLLPYQKMIVAHAIFCVLGFLLFLPAGALLARYMRTFVAGPTWFKGHWVVQFVIAGPMILIGVSLGISSVSTAKAPHLNDDHKRWGIAIFVLYLVQCGLGAVVHFIKKKDRIRRPPQNYVHAILGLAIIALAFYQVHTGYDVEWPTTTGRDPVPEGVNVFFWVWVVVLAVAYGAGLSFLPKQYRQERKPGRGSQGDDDRSHFNLKQTSYSIQ